MSTKPTGYRDRVTGEFRLYSESNPDPRDGGPDRAMSLRLELMTNYPLKWHQFGDNEPTVSLLVEEPRVDNSVHLLILTESELRTLFEKIHDLLTLKEVTR